MNAPPRTLIEPATKPHAFLDFMIASLRFNWLPVELGPAWMIGAVDLGMALQTSASVGLVRRALASQWNGPVARYKGSAGQVCSTVKALGMVAGVALLAEHGCARLQQRRHIGPVWRVAVGAVLNHGGVLPQKRTALFRVAGI